MQRMSFEARVVGTVEFVGVKEGKKDPSKKYPFFQVKQISGRGMSVVEVQGNGVKPGEKFEGNVLVEEGQYGLRVTKLQ